jgi:hypothetical protein
MFGLTTLVARLFPWDDLDFVKALSACSAVALRLETFTSWRVKSSNRKSANTVRSLVTELK